MKERRRSNWERQIWERIRGGFRELYALGWSPWGIARIAWRLIRKSYSRSK